LEAHYHNTEFNITFMVVIQATDMNTIINILLQSQTHHIRFKNNLSQHSTLNFSLSFKKD